MTAISFNSSHGSGARSGLPGPSGGKGAGFRSLGIRALLVLGATGALLWGVTHVSQRVWTPPPQVPVTLGGVHYRLAPGELQWLETFSARHFAEGRRASRQIVEAQIDARLDRLFAGARERLPDFADWYYSLPGEYTRAGVFALSAVGLAAPGYVARRAAATLFPGTAWTDSLARLENDTDARLAAEESDLRASWVAEVTRRLAAYRVPAPLPGVDTEAETSIDLDALLGRIAARERAALTGRLSVSTLAAGAAVLGPVLWRAVARGGEEAAARAAAERLAARGVARAGTAVVGAAALCSPGGPLAFGCAAAAGAAAWVGTDWALLEVDEHLHRQALLDELDAGLEALRARTRRDLLDTYDALIDGRYDAVRDDIAHGFVPASAGETPAPSGEDTAPPSGEDTAPSGEESAPAGGQTAVTGPPP